MPSPFTWTGFYIGVNAGGIWPSGGRGASLFDPNSGIDLGFINAGFPGGLGSQSAGFIGGGQAGYNWQTGAFVLGVETDFDGSTLSKSFSNVGAPFGSSLAISPGDFLTVNGKNSLTWLGTTRARVGFVATPDNRLMIYATGGVAYGGGNSQFTVFDETTNSLFSGQSELIARRLDDRCVSSSDHHQHHVTGEYLYADLGSSKPRAPRLCVAIAFPGVTLRKVRLQQRLDLPRGRELQDLKLSKLRTP